MARHRIASWLGFTGASLILTTPMALGAPESSLPAFHWLGVAGAAILLLTPVLATAEGIPPARSLPPTEIVQKVEAAGYKNLRDLEFDDGRWELDATSAAGMSVDLEVDPTTGKILHEEAD